MSDAKDAVAEALALNRRLAAARLVRRDELDAELARLRRARDEAAAAGGGPEAAELDARIAAAATERAAATHDLDHAVAEIKELEKLGRSADATAARAVVAAATTPSDPLIQSPEERALASARAHLAELEAQARLGDELGAAEREAAGEVPAPAAQPLSPAEADAQALEAFKALRARRDPGKGGGGGGGGGGKTL